MTKQISKTHFAFAPARFLMLSLALMSALAPRAAMASAATILGQREEPMPEHDHTELLRALRAKSNGITAPSSTKGHATHHAAPTRKTAPLAAPSLETLKIDDVINGMAKASAAATREKFLNDVDVFVANMPPESQLVFYKSIMDAIDKAPNRPGTYAAFLAVAATVIGLKAVHSGLKHRSRAALVTAFIASGTAIGAGFEAREWNQLKTELLALRRSIEALYISTESICKAQVL